MRRTVTALAVLLVAASAFAPPVAIGAPDGSAAASSAKECSFPMTETDATGTEVTVEEVPETVVTLNPSAAQTMWEIGAEGKVVGVTKHAMNLEGSDERTNVSSAGETINPEIVVDLDPDLVLAPSSQVVSEELVEVLREAGLTVYMHPSAESIDDVREKTRLTGALVGECEGAEETVEWMDREIGIVEAAVEGEERPGVLYTFFGFTAGEETFIHEIIEAGGGNNIAAEVGISEYEPVNEEMVVEENPEWIVLNTNSPELPDGEGYESTTAVEEDQILTLNVNHLNRPGPRIVHAIAALAEAFHPEAYADARAEAEATPDSETETPTEAADVDDQPGFGAALALVTLLLAAVVANRRSDVDR